MVRYDFPDAAWALILPLLPPERSQRPGHPYIEHRKVINGMFWVLCSGVPWRDLPERYGSWKTVYNRFNRWAKKASLTLYLIGYFPFLMSISCSTGLLSLWMAAIFVQCVVLPVPKKIADRAIFMDHGCIVEQDPAKELFTNPQHQHTKQFMDNSQR